jgi:ketosteroid isomerase-like protein
LLLLLAGVLVGCSTADSTDDGSEPILIAGNYIFQEQDDGSWKLHRDIYNYNPSE